MNDAQLIEAAELCMDARPDLFRPRVRPHAAGPDQPSSPAPLLDQPKHDPLAGGAAEALPVDRSSEAISAASMDG